MQMSIDDTSKSERSDFWNLIAVRKHGCPEGWRWTSLETIDPNAPRNKAQCLVTGAVYGTYVKSGKRKGDLNFKKPNPGTERRLVVSFAELDAFRDDWEKETGKCSDCGGCGRDAFSASSGRPCRRCGGDGKARAS